MKLIISSITDQNTSTDTTAPRIYPVPSDITTRTDVGRPTAVVRWKSPAAHDDSSVTLTSNWDPGSVFPIGETTVTYTAVDEFENVATESFRVTVEGKFNRILMCRLLINKTKQKTTFLLNARLRFLPPSLSAPR